MDTNILIGIIYAAVRIAGLVALVIFAIVEIRRERNR
jgi:hypothetical protein